VSEIVAEIGEQDVLAELVQRHTGVTRQPVFDDLGLVFHAGIMTKDGVRLGHGLAAPSSGSPGLSSSTSVAMPRDMAP
jgi:hypothetical protein